MSLIDYVDSQLDYGYLGPGGGALTQDEENAAATEWWDVTTTTTTGGPTTAEQQGSSQGRDDASSAWGRGARKQPALGNDNETTEDPEDTEGDLLEQPELRHRPSLAGVQGLVWHAQVVRDDFQDPKHCLPDGSLKPRRPVPQVRSSDFFPKLRLTEKGKWVFPGSLNAWPALRNLEVLAVTAKISRLGIRSLGRVKRVWSAEQEEKKNPDPASRRRPFFPDNARYVRVTLRGDPWTARGYAPDSKGFAFWFRALQPTSQGGPTLAHGQHMFDLADPNATITRAHLLSHRYAKKRESPKDLLTYHSAVILEWNHKRHCTVVELAWLNGLGGYGGRSNWCLDLLSVDPPPALRSALPAEMIQPWRSSMAELRVVDHPATEISAFRGFLAKHTGIGPDGRFFVPDISRSADVKLSNRSQIDLVKYLLNYINRSTEYNELSRNCQTFAADLFGFLCDQHVVPYHPICRPLYQRHTSWFLYDS